MKSCTWVASGLLLPLILGFLVAVACGCRSGSPRSSPVRETTPPPATAAPTPAPSPQAQNPVIPEAQGLPEAEPEPNGPLPTLEVRARPAAPRPNLPEVTPNAAPREDVLKSLEQKIRPPAAARPEELREKAAQAEETVKGWVKAIAGGQAAEARAALITQEDLDAVTMEGMRTILSGHLLPENQKNLSHLLEFAKKKEVNLSEWKAGKLTQTERGTLYKERMPILQSCLLELVFDNEPVEMKLDLLYLKDRWKLFKLEMVENEK